MVKIAIIIVIVFLSIVSIGQTNSKDFPVLKGPYLGQKPPGNIPKLFAPGIVSRDGYFEHNAAIFSPDGNEVYWSGKPNGARYFEINCMKMINGKWCEPRIAFACEGFNFYNPIFSSDGKTLYFKKDGDIWFVERQDDEWSKETKMSSVINSNVSDDLHTITENGSVYFRRHKPNEPFGKRSLIYFSRKTNGNYTEPELIEGNINSDDEEELAIFVAPDESYMIIEATKDRRFSKLYISYKKKDGLWTERIKLPFENGRFPLISPDGKYLFYMTRDEGIYWVSTFFIEELKPKNL